MAEWRVFKCSNCSHARTNKSTLWSTIYIDNWPFIAAKAAAISETRGACCMLVSSITTLQQ